jgi:hypothetical protein
MYADINGLKMFYEIDGTSGPARVPVVWHCRWPRSRTPR